MIIASAVYLSARKNLSTKEELLFVQTAALLHDIGHLPFSHLIEEIFDEFGWIPDGESTPFDHEYYTKIKIQKLFLSSPKSPNAYAELFNILKSSGYNKEDIINLINGESGVGYLDAIINGPIDCDKMEYIFSDGCFVGKNHESLFNEFLTEYCSELGTNDNCFLKIYGKSYKNALKLIELRSQMYDGVYLRPGLRYLESCCKLIIRIFIAYKCTKIDLSELDKENPNINLSDVKIRFIVAWIEEIERDYCSQKITSDTSPFELYLIDKMCEYLKEWGDIISSDLRDAIAFCKKMIKCKSTNASSFPISDIEQKYIHQIKIVNSNLNEKHLNKLMKTVYLRFPGIILIDSVKIKNPFSFSKSGKKQRHMDGTNESIESILISQDNAKNWKCFGDATEDIINQLNLPRDSYLNLYKITKDHYRYMLAEDFVIDQLRHYGIIEGA
jgi:HD superfamily phosphohydrolase